MKLFVGSKRGVSPLIATILIVALSIVLGAVVMLFGQDFFQGVESQTTQIHGRLSCSTEVHVDVIDACFVEDTGRINILIGNKRNNAFVNDNFYVRIYQPRAFDLQPFKINNLGPAEIDKVYANYHTKHGNPTKISLIPVVVTGGKELLCTDNERAYALSACE